MQEIHACTHYTVCPFVSLFIHIHVHASGVYDQRVLSIVSAQICMHAHMTGSVNVYVNVYICVYEGVHVYMYTNIQVYMYAHIHT